MSPTLPSGYFKYSYSQCLPCKKHKNLKRLRLYNRALQVYKFSVTGTDYYGIHEDVPAVIAANSDATDLFSDICSTFFEFSTIKEADRYIRSRKRYSNKNYADKWQYEPTCKKEFSFDALQHQDICFCDSFSQMQVYDQPIEEVSSLTFLSYFQECLDFFTTKNPIPDDHVDQSLAEEFIETPCKLQSHDELCDYAQLTDNLNILIANEELQQFEQQLEQKPDLQDDDQEQCCLDIDCSPDFRLGSTHHFYSDSVICSEVIEPEILPSMSLIKDEIILMSDDSVEYYSADESDPILKSVHLDPEIIGSRDRTFSEMESHSRSIRRGRVSIELDDLPREGIT